MGWRVVITDTETASGIAPVCPHQGDATKHSCGWNPTEADEMGVYDCCPGPHLQCWSERTAVALAAALTEADVEVCE